MWPSPPLPHKHHILSLASVEVSSAAMHIYLSAGCLQQRTELRALTQELLTILTSNLKITFLLRYIKTNDMDVGLDIHIVFK